MSLAETQQIMQTLQQIMAILNKVEVKTVSINSDLPKTKDALFTFRELERVAIRYLAIVRRTGLPDDVQSQITRLSQLLVMIRMLHMSYNMLLAGTPFGILMGVAGFAMSGLALYDSQTGV